MARTGPKNNVYLKQIKQQTNSQSPSILVHHELIYIILSSLLFFTLFSGWCYHIDAQTEQKWRFLDSHKLLPLEDYHFKPPNPTNTNTAQPPGVNTTQGTGPNTHHTQEERRGGPLHFSGQIWPNKLPPPHLSSIGASHVSPNHLVCNVFMLHLTTPIIMMRRAKCVWKSCKLTPSLIV
jgi:hypothetical protein